MTPIRLAASFPCHLTPSTISSSTSPLAISQTLRRPAVRSSTPPPPTRSGSRSSSAPSRRSARSSGWPRPRRATASGGESTTLSFAATGPSAPALPGVSCSRSTGCGTTRRPCSSTTREGRSCSPRLPAATRRRRSNTPTTRTMRGASCAGCSSRRSRPLATCSPPHSAATRGGARRGARRNSRRTARLSACRCCSADARGAEEARSTGWGSPGARAAQLSLFS
mmetsp:Transcript_47248/g.148544  ORF Transcript_47248/g.148544 Transcript_47248/m.148544 type:complete len:224 (+) Transcript_47248:2-673(+)